jgi:very-short-patch-repair endonuclease
VQNELTNVANDPLLTLVTHHNFDFDYVGANGKVLTLSNEYELIDQDIIDGFMLNKAILNGEGPSYNNAQVGLLTMSKRLERFRGEVSFWMEELIFKQASIWNGFSVEGKRGQEEIIYPTVKWDDLELRDNSNKLQILQAAQTAGVVSAQTLIEELGLNYDQEVERLRFENTAGFISSPDQNMGGMGGGYGGAGGGAGGLGDMLGGVGGGVEPGAEQGAEPSMPGLPGGAPEGGAPATPMASTKGSMEQYRFASKIVNDIYNEKKKTQEDKINTRLAGKNIKNAFHQEFLDSFPLVTGRGDLGPLPEEPSVFVESEFIYPVDGGPCCFGLNVAAVNNLYNIRSAKKQERQPPKMLFSKLEQKLYNLILSTNVSFPFYAQFQAGPGLQYQIDGAFPTIKLGMEADSKTFHDSPEKIASDKQRDMNLAAQGWTMLRFTEEEIMQQPQEVVNVVMKVMNQLAGGGQSPGNPTL